MIQFDSVTFHHNFVTIDLKSRDSEEVEPAIYALLTIVAGGFWRRSLEKWRAISPPFPIFCPIGGRLFFLKAVIGNALFIAVIFERQEFARHGDLHAVALGIGFAFKLHIEVDG